MPRPNKINKMHVAIFMDREKNKISFKTLAKIYNRTESRIRQIVAKEKGLYYEKVFEMVCKEIENFNNNGHALLCHIRTSSPEVRINCHETSCKECWERFTKEQVKGEIK